MEVKSPVGGQLSELIVSNGDQVVKGDVLSALRRAGRQGSGGDTDAAAELEEERIEDQLRSNDQRQATLQRNIKLTEQILERRNRSWKPVPSAKFKFCSKPINWKLSEMS